MDTNVVLGHRDVVLGHRDVVFGHRDVDFGHRDIVFGHRDVVIGHRNVVLGHRDVVIVFENFPSINKYLRYNLTILTLNMPFPIVASYVTLLSPILPVTSLLCFNQALKTLMYKQFVAKRF